MLLSKKAPRPSTLRRKSTQRKRAITLLAKGTRLYASAKIPRGEYKSCERRGATARWIIDHQRHCVWKKEVPVGTCQKVPTARLVPKIPTDVRKKN